jgi:hypothetical protein
VYGRTGIRKAVVQTVGFIALAAVPVFVLNALATADTASGPPSSTFIVPSSSSSTPVTKAVPFLLVPAPPGVPWSVVPVV